MIKFEHNMLVLNSFFSEEDVDQIDAFAEYVRQQERERIIALPLLHEGWGGTHNDIDCITCYNINLIKGETNG
jgi:hypothetical protein